MALLLDATPGSPSANTYVLEEEANDYIEGRIYSEAWTEHAESVPSALVTATRLLDEQIDWNGARTYLNQALEFPRTDIYDRAGIEFSSLLIPEWLKNATIEYALSLLSNNWMEGLGLDGFKSIKVDVIKIDVDKFDKPNVMPQSVYNMIRFYGTKIGEQFPRTYRV